MDVIILAALAVYIFIKLRKQLGKIDEEQKRDAIRNFVKEQTKIRDSKSESNKQGVVVDMSGKEVVVDDDTSQFDEKSQKILDEVDNNIREDLISVLSKVGIGVAAFVDGSGKAFEMVIEAFAKGDIKALTPLLSDKILQQFKLVIKDRKSKNQLLNTKIIAIDGSKIIAAKMIKSYATITVKFISKQVNYITDKDGKIIEGSKEEVNVINDVWTFKKDYKSSNPNWFVSATTS